MGRKSTRTSRRTDKLPKRGRAGTAPLFVRLLRLGFRTLGPVAPVAMGALAERIWGSTLRLPERPEERRLLDEAEPGSVSTDRHSIVTYTWGNGENVLLVHGWNGHTGHLSAFISPLMKEGYRVIGFDAPGHGRSMGTRTNVVQISAIMHELADRYGSLSAVLGHSFGGMCAAYAMSAGLPVQRAVCIASPASMNWLVRRLAAYLHLPAPVVKELQRRAERRIGEKGWQSLSNGRHAAGLSQPALIIHDRQDEVVPWQQGQAFAESWPGARLLSTSGLGHQRILRAPRVVQEVTQFVRATP